MSRSQKQPCLRISFAENPTVHSLPRLSLSSQELESVWYSEHELDLILHECGASAAAALLPDTDNSSAETTAPTTTLRGLELMTPQGFSLAIIHDELVHQVLQEQTRLRQIRGDHDHADFSEALGAFQRQGSSHRQRIAHLRGLADAQAVGKNVVMEMPMKHSSQRRLSMPDRRRRRSERLLRPSLPILIRTGSNRSISSINN
jgi:hypothetical protein